MRISAVELLGRIGDSAAPFSALIAASVNDSDWNVCFLAVRALGGLVSRPSPRALHHCALGTMHYVTVRYVTVCLATLTVFGV